MSTNNNHNNNTKMKGLLKGLRYISQIFDNEKEPEMQIGFPTDVKHVAHIGWDGPSVNNAPSWMNEFKSPPEFASAPLATRGEAREKGSEAVKWVSEDSSRRAACSQSSRDLPELPRSSRRHSAGAPSDSPSGEKSDKPKTSRRSSKNSSKESESTKSRKPKDSSQESESSSQDVPDIPKKSRRKKSKDSSSHGGGSSRRSRNQDTDAASESGSVSKPHVSEHCHSSAVDSFDGEEKGFTGIS